MPQKKTEMNNPLYDKLFARFSQDGKTVGELMRSKAENPDFFVGMPKSEALTSFSAEDCITKANALPRASLGDGSLVIRRTRKVTRLEPSALLAALLGCVILLFVLASGLRALFPATPRFDQVEDLSKGTVVYTLTADEVTSLNSNEL